MHALAVEPNSRVHDRPVVRLTRREISRLLSAAVVSRTFAKALLTNPKQALESGYQGQSFRFSSAEIEMISSIHASNLQEFAEAVTGLTALDDSSM